MGSLRRNCANVGMAVRAHVDAEGEMSPVPLGVGVKLVDSTVVILMDRITGWLKNSVRV